jgi:mRNA interferase MazF
MANQAALESGRGVVTVVPLTTNTKVIRPFQVLMPADAGTGLAEASKAQAEQIRAVGVSRLTQPIGLVDESVMRSLEAAIRLHLGL